MANSALVMLWCGGFHVREGLVGSLEEGLLRIRGAERLWEFERSSLTEREVKEGFITRIIQPQNHDQPGSCGDGWSRAYVEDKPGLRHYR